MLYLLLFLPQVFAKENNFVGVPTSHGLIIGQLTKSRYGALSIFYGVPYALVDENNKFGEALPYPNFTTFKALTKSESCPHPYGGVLQCLTLNIIVPIIKSNVHPFPVVIWFFGGFMMRNPNDYDGRHIAKHGVIVVTVNYRVGPYGFFCLDHIKNQGLKDQKRAVKWVKNNIKAFGGDPEKITIGGQSYGGGAVDFHLYDKQRYFNRAIIQSGSRFAKGITSKKDNAAPIKIANYFRSNATNTKEALEFLNNLDHVAVMSSVRNLNLKFGVCRDKYNYVDHIKNTAILIGYNSKEDLAAYALQPRQYFHDIEDIFFDYLSQNFRLDNVSLNAFARIVKKFYLGSTKISRDTMLGLTDFSSDIKLNFAVERSVKKYLLFNATKVYKYLFSYTGRSPFKNIRGIGAFHAEELQYLFEKDTQTFNAEQIVLRDKMTEMWANFIKYGNPNPLQYYNGPAQKIWRPTNLKKRYYFHIDKEMFLSEYLLHKRMAFWDLLRSFYKYIIKDRANHDENDDIVLNNTLVSDEHNILRDNITPRTNEVYNKAMLSVTEDPEMNILSTKDEVELEIVTSITPFIDKHRPTMNPSTNESIVDYPNNSIMKNLLVSDEPKSNTTPGRNEASTDHEPVITNLKINDEYELTTTMANSNEVVTEDPVRITVANDDSETYMRFVAIDVLNTTPIRNEVTISDGNEGTPTPSINEITEDPMMSTELLFDYEHEQIHKEMMRLIDILT